MSVRSGRRSKLATTGPSSRSSTDRFKRSGRPSGRPYPIIFLHIGKLVETELGFRRPLTLVVIKYRFALRKGIENDMTCFVI